MWRRGFIIAGGAALVLALAVILNHNPGPPPQRLPDGTTIALASVKIGPKAEFIPGSLWQKALYYVLPAKGLRLGSHLLPPPRKWGPVTVNGRDAVFLEFNVENLPASCFCRLVVCDEDGFEFNQSGLFQIYNGYQVTVASFYPRQSKTLDIRLERSENTQSVPPSQIWRTIARFNVPNRPRPAQPWNPEPLPAKRTIGDKEFTLGGVAVEELPQGMGVGAKYQGQISLKAVENGQPSYNWKISRLVAEDAGGNEINSTDLSAGQPGYEWMFLQMAQVLDPRQVWRMRLSLGRARDFAASNLVTLSLNLPAPPPPIVSGVPGATTSFTTNVLGVPLQVFLTATETRFALPTNRADLCLDLVGVKTPDASRETRTMLLTRFDPDGGLRLRNNFRGATNVTFTLAIHPNYQVEFFLRPTGLSTGYKAQLTSGHPPLLAVHSAIHVETGINHCRRSGAAFGVRRLS